MDRDEPRARSRAGKRGRLSSICAHGFTEIKPQMEQFPPNEMLKALTFLRSRLRADTATNREELAR
jgi:hypothetical protein